MTAATVLVVEDDASLRDALCDTLDLAGYETLAAEDGVSALDILEKQTPGMVVSDIKMEPMDGHSLLNRIQRSFPEVPVLLMTAFGNIEQAVRAMQEGAVDYLVKPFEAEALVETVGRYVCEPQSPSDMIAEDAATQKILALARRVAASDATVMITGDSGTGKEVLARYIHAHSPRAARPFVAINCAAIPDTMLEATLFGHEKGAFTGAYKTTAGKFEQAHGGTLLLDEISEMDLGLQAKLLRVLQEREVERLGGNKTLELDVRVLATSNRSLPAEVEAGRFREDLFYRLNVFPIQLPPLRERPGDILALAEFFLRRHAKGNERVPTFSADAQQWLLTHQWPGNVRELENLLHRARILCDGEQIKPEDLHVDAANQARPTAESTVAQPAANGNDLGNYLKSREETCILETLRAVEGNREAAAKRLGISPRTLRYKLARMRDAGIEIH